MTEGRKEAGTRTKEARMKVEEWKVEGGRWEVKKRKLPGIEDGTLAKSFLDVLQQS